MQSQISGTCENKISKENDRKQPKIYGYFKLLHIIKTLVN